MRSINLISHLFAENQILKIDWVISSSPEGTEQQNLKTLKQEVPGFNKEFAFSKWLWVPDQKTTTTAFLKTSKFFAAASISILIICWSPILMNVFFPWLKKNEPATPTGKVEPKTEI